MTVLGYTLAFMFFCIIVSWMIQGLHMAMEGREKVNRFGSVVYEGDILYGIARELRSAKKTTYLLASDGIVRLIKNMELKYGQSFPSNAVDSMGEVGVIVWDAARDNSKLIGFLQNLQISEGVKYSEWIPAKQEGDIKYYTLSVDEVKNKYNKFISKSIGIGCIRCAASFYSMITYWPIVLFIFGFNIIEIPIYLTAIPVITFLNYYFYKKA